MTTDTGRGRWILPDDLLAAIRAEASRRDLDRALPERAIRHVLDHGLGAARVPREHGGRGLTVSALVDELHRLAAADSNVAHAFRGHLAFVEQQFFEPDQERRELWFTRIVAGDLVGNAQSEAATRPDLNTTLVDKADGGLELNGRKYYTTGSLFADWIDLAARYENETYQVVVSTKRPGVLSHDDWGGFGQRLTGSGTTIFDHVTIDRADIRPYSADHDGFRHPYLMGFYQLMLLSVLSGIARAALEDVVDYVRPRERTFGVVEAAPPRFDPLVQGILGQLSSSVFAARAIVRAAAGSLDAAMDGYADGAGDASLFSAAQLDVYRAQQPVIDTVLDVTTRLFEVGGASAVDSGLNLDRHWRNARTVATHNPAVHRLRAIGEWELDRVEPAWPVRPL